MNETLTKQDQANTAAYNDVLEEASPSQPKDPCYMKAYRFWYAVAHPQE